MISPPNPDRPGPAAVQPGDAAVCPGVVMHHRRYPTVHRFTAPVSYVWIDPDRPGALTDQHPLWSAERAAPARFRRVDYLDGADTPLGPAVRAVARPVVDHPRTVAGPLRMLTQIRRWGWLFNPITVYLLWPEPAGLVERFGGPTPTVAVLEVSNTPWKQRWTYPVPLDTGTEGLRGRFDKVLHVSPFLDEGWTYDLRIASGGPDGRGITVGIDVTAPTEPTGRPGPGSAPVDPVVLTTQLAVRRTAPTRSSLSRTMLRNPLSTHRVSAGIHRQALALWRAKVPVHPHPDRRASRNAPAGGPTS
ncbi:MAG: DUF1365 domain-containing protein [Acidimicrobiales bacterium]